MKRLLVITLAGLSLVSSRAAETDREIDARRVALELAGAFSNDGFKMRDGHWSGELKKGESKVVAVNLYAGNQYWFSVGADGAKTVRVHVFDESGKPLATENYEDEAKAAAGFAPTMSGQYFVAIDPVDQDDDGAFCLVYSYR